MSQFLKSTATNPIANIRGEPLMEVPRGLFIPPDALEVFLDTFQGPLDLLLYLIRKHNLEVLDIPMAELTRQYMAYVEIMHASQLELAAEYLLMTALLIEIKSRMLLPRPIVRANEDDVDPRAELVRRLLEYEQMKLAALRLNEMPQAERDFTPVQVLIVRHRNVPMTLAWQLIVMTPILISNPMPLKSVAISLTTTVMAISMMTDPVH